MTWKVFFSQRGGIFLIVLCLGLASGLWLLMKSPKTPPFMVLSQPVSMPRTFRDRIERWLPTSPGWGWLWRVESLIFGPRKTVNLSAQVMRISNEYSSFLDSLPPQPPTFSHTNGVILWLLDSAQLAVLRKALSQNPDTETLGKPRLTTADGIESRIFMGQSLPTSPTGPNTEIGLSLDCLARLEAHATDFIAVIRQTEPSTNSGKARDQFQSPALPLLRTNLDTAFRVRIPRDQGLLLLQRHPEGLEGKSMAVIIDPPQFK